MTYEVSPDKLVPDLYPEFREFVNGPRVFATGYLVGLLEQVCMELLEWYRCEGERVLGTNAEVRHRIACAPGTKLTVQCWCTSIRNRHHEFFVNRFYEFLVNAVNDRGQVIGMGIIEQAVVDEEWFQQQIVRPGPPQLAASMVSGASTHVPALPIAVNHHIN
jgi:fluoroacetyl-CoA thioesterase